MPMPNQKRHGPKTADELMAELAADPAFQRQRAERQAAHSARLHASAPDFELVRGALEAAGIDSADFSRFTSNRHPDVIRPSAFDHRSAVPVLLAVLPLVSHPNAKEAVVRSLTTSYARSGLQKRLSASSAIPWRSIIPHLNGRSAMHSTRLQPLTTSSPCSSSPLTRATARAGR